MSQLDIVKRSSLHSIHLELNASMIEESRWERPNWYIDPDKEMAQHDDCNDKMFIDNGWERSDIFIGMK